MSTIDDDRDVQQPYDDPPLAQAEAPVEELPRFENPIVPDNTIGGRALIAVIAIMTFLASLTTGAVILVRAAAGDWQSEVAREVTIQVRRHARPRHRGRRAARGRASRARLPGVADVRAYSRDESARLLEPWLGAGLSLDDLPVPRIVVVRLDTEPAPDLAELRRRLAAEVPSASLDDHRNFVERMRAMANAALFVGLAVLALVLLATVLVGGVRHPRRDGGQPHGDRGAAFHRRQERLHRRSLPAPLPAARPAGRRDRRRRRAVLVRARGARQPLAAGNRRGASVHRPCSARFRSGSPATSRWSCRFS